MFLPLSNSLNLLEATIRHNRKRRILTPAEILLERQLKGAFKSQGKILVKRLAKLKGHFQEASGDFMDPLMDDVFGDTGNLFLEPLSAAVKAMLLSGAKVMIGDLKLDFSFSLKNPRAVDYLKAHGADLVASIDDTTRERVKTLVTQAVDEGWSYGDTARQMVQLYDEFAEGRPQDNIASRAHMIAVTEAGNSYEEGNYEVISGLKDDGIDAEKSWDTSSSASICDECQANADEGWIPAEDVHQSGDDHPLAHPGCECDEEYRVV